VILGSYPKWGLSLTRVGKDIHHCLLWSQDSLHITIKINNIGLIEIIDTYPFGPFTAHMPEGCKGKTSLGQFVKIFLSFFYQPDNLQGSQQIGIFFLKAAGPACVPKASFGFVGSEKRNIFIGA
jgi:hypothetical protein